MWSDKRVYLKAIKSRKLEKQFYVIKQKRLSKRNQKSKISETILCDQTGAFILKQSTVEN